MNTINSPANSFSLAAFVERLIKIEPDNHNKENNKTILPIAKFIAAPIIIVKNAAMLFAIGKVKKSLTKLIVIAEKTFPHQDEMQRAEFYADLNALKENINEAVEEGGLHNPQGGYISRLICKRYLEINDFINEKDDFFYRLTYPNNKDANGKDFIDEVKAAHLKSDTLLLQNAY